MNLPPRRPIFAALFRTLSDVLDTIQAVLGCAMAVLGTLFVLAFIAITIYPLFVYIRNWWK